MRGLSVDDLVVNDDMVWQFCGKGTFDKKMSMLEENEKWSYE